MLLRFLNSDKCISFLYDISFFSSLFQGVIVRFILILIVITVSINLTQAQNKTYFQGEDLLYEVSYYGIKLGSIRIISEGAEDYQGTTTNKAKALIRSYSGIPFVDINVIYQSWMDQSLNFSRHFESNIKDGNGWNFEEIRFKYDKGLIEYDRFEKNKVKDTYIYKTKKKYNDGMSLFFFARNNVLSNKRYKVPCHVSDTITTNLNFLGRIEKVETDAIKYPVSTVYFNGELGGEGVYGMTGKFEGWFSNDEAKVPIKAKVKVYIGNVDIKLIEWKRGNWMPPRG